MNPLSFTPTEEVLKWKEDYDKRVAELELMVQMLENRVGELEQKSDKGLELSVSKVNYETAS